jgi:guanine nucleotide-binding protein G(o) subunit alpha
MYIYPVLFEDPAVNRMHESLRLFEDVVANPLFKDTPIYLLLNKKDLFETMIPEVPLTVCFPEYTGAPGDVRAALGYVESRFKEIHDRRCPHKSLKIFIIAARVRMDMKASFGEIKDELKRAVTNRLKNAPHLKSAPR